MKASPTVTGKKSCARVLFGPADHKELFSWLAECEERQQRQLVEKYGGFDVTRAEEGVHAVVVVDQP